MGFLSRLFGRSSDTQEAPAQTQEQTQVACPHATITGRWDSVEDMGYEDRATRFVCEACNAEFTPEEAKEIRENARLPLTDTTPSTNQ